MELKYITQTLQKEAAVVLLQECLYVRELQSASCESSDIGSKSTIAVSQWEPRLV